VRFGLRACRPASACRTRKRWKATRKACPSPTSTPAWREAPRGQGRSQPFGAAHDVQRAVAKPRTRSPSGAELLDTTTLEYLTGIAKGGVYAIAATGLPTHTLAQVIGGTGTAKYFPSGALGGNALSDFAADRIVYGGTATASANIQATDKMSLSVVDKLVEKAKLASPTMRKASFDGKNVWVLLMHPYQVSAMRSNTNTGQWLDIQKALTMGGGKGLLFDEALGIYRDVLFVESTRIPLYLAGAGNAISCARAVFLGAQAGVMAAGREGSAGLRQAEAGGKDVRLRQALRHCRDVHLRHGSLEVQWQSDFAAFAVDTAAAPL
jgi:hypothetical protein